MAYYTRVNLMDVEHIAPQFGFAPDLEARFAPAEDAEQLPGWWSD